MYVLAACTQAKRGKPHEALQLRSHPGADASAVFHSWHEAVAAASSRGRAVDVYKGAYWRAVQVLSEQIEASVLVASAGMGLISQVEIIPVYSATFVAGDHDSIPEAGTMEGRRAWWEMLGGASALEALELDEPLVVVLPATYLRLVEPELTTLAERFGEDRVVVFGPASGARGPLAGSWVSLDARMAWNLGTNVSALAPSVARHCLEATAGVLDHAAVRDAASSLVTDRKDPVYPKRARQTVDQVRAWLEAVLREQDAPTSASAALRRFRDSGRAFEQRAFHGVYHEVSASLEKRNA